MAPLCLPLLRCGWMQLPRSSSPWAQDLESSLPWPVTTHSTTTVTGEGSRPSSSRFSPELLSWVAAHLGARCWEGISLTRLSSVPGRRFAPVPGGSPRWVAGLGAKRSAGPQKRAACGSQGGVGPSYQPAAFFLNPFLLPAGTSARGTHGSVTPFQRRHPDQPGQLLHQLPLGIRHFHRPGLHGRNAAHGSCRRCEGPRFVMASWGPQPLPPAGAKGAATASSPGEDQG